MARSYIDFQEPRQGGATASKQAILHVTVREACVSRDKGDTNGNALRISIPTIQFWTLRVRKCP